MMLDVIKKVFDEMIFTVCMGIDEEDWPVIREEYHKLLIRRYSETDVELKLNDYDKVYKIVYNIEYKRWTNLSPFIKKNLLIVDNALNNVMCISNLGFDFALKRLKDDSLISAEEADTQINKMNEIYKNVRKENKFTADKYISEGTIDLLFASNQTDAMSLRLSRYPNEVLKR